MVHVTCAKRRRRPPITSGISKRLKEKRHELDAGIVEADPKDITPALRHGLVVLLTRTPWRTYWGRECKEEWRYKTKWLYGCVNDHKLSQDVRGVVEKIEDSDGGHEMTARGIIEAMAAKDLSNSTEETKRV